MLLPPSRSEDASSRSASPDVYPSRSSPRPEPPIHPKPDLFGVKPPLGALDPGRPDLGVPNPLYHEMGAIDQRVPKPVVPPRGDRVSVASAPPPPPVPSRGRAAQTLISFIS